jgi:hypothetical protein
MSQKKMNRRYCGCFQLLDVGEGNQNVLPVSVQIRQCVTFVQTLPGSL